MSTFDIDADLAAAASEAFLGVANGGTLAARTNARQSECQGAAFPARYPRREAVPSGRSHSSMKPDRDEQGKPYTVRYEAVKAMLLNEFLKEHRKVAGLEAKPPSSSSRKFKP